MQVTRHEDGSATIATADGKMDMSAQQFAGLIGAIRSGLGDQVENEKPHPPEDDS